MAGQSEKILDQHQLRKTRVRRRVLNIFLDSEKALGNKELEDHFEEVDRITLYRTLRTFRDHGLIHRAIDGGNRPKFALCSTECTEQHHRDHHAHFHCEECGKTLCLENVETPDVRIPEGLTVSSTHLVLQGICPSCSK